MQELRQGTKISPVSSGSHLHEGRSTPLEPFNVLAPAAEELWPSLIKGSRFLFTSLPVAHPPTRKPLLPQKYPPTPKPLPPGSPASCAPACYTTGFGMGGCALCVSRLVVEHQQILFVSRMGVVTEEKWEGLQAVCFLFKSRDTQVWGWGGQDYVLRSTISQEYEVTEGENPTVVSCQQLESDSHNLGNFSPGGWFQFQVLNHQGCGYCNTPIARNVWSDSRSLTSSTTVVKLTGSPLDER